MANASKLANEDTEGKAILRGIKRMRESEYAGPIREAKEHAKGMTKQGFYGYLGQREYRKAVQAQSRPQMIQARLARGQFRYNMARSFIPIIIFIVLLYFILGPGLTSIMIILGSMTWWMWVLAIFIIILWFRNKFG